MKMNFKIDKELREESREDLTLKARENISIVQEYKKKVEKSLERLEGEFRKGTISYIDYEEGKGKLKGVKAGYEIYLAGARKRLEDLREEKKGAERREKGRKKKGEERKQRASPRLITNYAVLCILIIGLLGFCYWEGEDKEAGAVTIEREGQEIGLETGQEINWLGKIKESFKRPWGEITGASLVRIGEEEERVIALPEPSKEEEEKENEEDEGEAKEILLNETDNYLTNETGGANNTDETSGGTGESRDNISLEIQEEETISSQELKILADEVTITGALSDATKEYGPSPNIVFINSTTGYVFYLSSTGGAEPRYQKTNDGGATWSGERDIGANKLWASIAVWYDQWTPGNTTGTKIHMVASEAATDDIWYGALDTTDDSLSFDPTNWTQAMLGGTVTSSTNGAPSITKSTNNVLYIYGCHDAVCNVSNSSNGAVWTYTNVESGMNPDDEDNGQLFPLSNGDVLLALHDKSANSFLSKVYNGTNQSWEGSWTTVDSSVVSNITYDVAFGGSLNWNTGDVYVVGNNDVSKDEGDMEAYRFNNTARSWTTLTPLFSNRKMTQGAIVTNQSNGDLYAVYIRGAPGDSMYIVYQKSTDGGITWSGEGQKLNGGVGDDYKYVRTNFMDNNTLYAVWYDDDDDDLFGKAIDSKVNPGNYFGDEYTLLDDSAGTSTQNGVTSKVVFINDSQGYVFYVKELTDTLHYKKTTDGGASWGTESNINNTDIDWNRMSVWYDQWTPGDNTGTIIYIVATDYLNDDLWYKTLNTTNGDALSPSGEGMTRIISGDSLGPGYQAAPVITKGTDGTLYASFSHDFISEVFNSSDGSTWVNTSVRGSGGINPAADDHQLLFPLSNGDILYVLHDQSANDLLSKFYNKSNQSWGGWTTINSNFTYDATYETAYGGAINNNTGDVYIIGSDRAGYSYGDILAYRFNDTTRSWSSLTSVAADKMVTQTAAAIDARTGDIYAIYLNGTAGTSTEVHYSVSTNGGSTWTEQNGTSLSYSDSKDIWVNILSSERIYAMWNDEDFGNYIGATIVNLSAVVAAANNIPAVALVKINATSLDNYTTDNLICWANVTDSDGGNVWVNYTWYNDSGAVGITGQAGSFTASSFNNVSTLGSGNTTTGQNWSCGVVGYDGTDYGNWSNSSNVTIKNSVPVVSSLVLNSTNPATNDTDQNLTAYATTSDGDGDSVKVIYNWYRNNTAIAVLNMPFERANGTGNTAIDYSGFGNNGSVSGATWNTTGGYDRKGAYMFDGINDYITMPGSSSLEVGCNGALEAWMMTQNWTGWGYIVVKNSTGWTQGYNYYSLHLNYNGFLRFDIGNDTTPRILSSDGVVNNTAFIGRMHHVVGVWNGTRSELYIDGVLNNSANYIYKTCPTRGSDSLWIGGLSSGYRLNGTIDEVRIWNISLSAGQVLALYQNRTDLIVSQETLVGDTWNVSATPNDGTEDGGTVMSGAVTILGATANTAPTAPVLLLPTNGSSTINRTPTLTWNTSDDTDGNPVSYNLLIDNSSDFTSPEVNVSGLTNSSPKNMSYTITTDLDVDKTYFWKVRANDTTEYGDYSGRMNFTVDSYLVLSILKGTVQFGAMNLGEMNDTTDGYPLPFLVENGGNILTNVTITGAQLFTRGGFPSSNFQFKIAENETGSFNTTNSTISWTNVPSSSSRIDVFHLNWTENNDTFKVDLNVTVPSDEPQGLKNSSITFTAAYG